MSRSPRNIPPLHFSIPANFNIDDAVRHHPPAFPFKPDVCASFLHFLNYKLRIEETKAVRLKMRYLQLNIHRDIAKYIRWLEQGGVIRVSSTYQTGVRAKTYSFQPAYQASRRTKYRVTDRTTYEKHHKAINRPLSKHPISEVLPDDVQEGDVVGTSLQHLSRDYAIECFHRCGFEFSTPCERIAAAKWYVTPPVCSPNCSHHLIVHPYPTSEPLHSPYPSVAVQRFPNNDAHFCTYASLVETERYLLKCLQGVTLKPGWKEFIKRQHEMGTWSGRTTDDALSDCQRIEDGVFRFKRDATAQRLHTSITGLKSELRQFLILDGCDDLVEIDIRASQPYLLLGLMRWGARWNYEGIPSEQSIREWEAFVCGRDDPYTTLASDLSNAGGKHLNRQDAKEGFMRVLFSHSKQRHPLKAIFADRFPEVFAFVTGLNRFNNRDCAVLLQEYEAAIVIERVASQLAALELPLLTVHDSIIVKFEDMYVAAQVIANELTRTVGTEPVLRVRRLSPRLRITR